MDKKKIYIIIIVLCVAVSAGVIYYGFFSSPSAEAPTIVPPAAELEAARQASQSGQSRGGGLPDPDAPTVFPVPRVFPQDTSLDLSVYNSAKLRALQDYAPLTVTEEELGRDNPFVPYQ
jgi:hypothetical protein